MNGAFCLLPLACITTFQSWQLSIHLQIFEVNSNLVDHSFKLCSSTPGYHQPLEFHSWSNNHTSLHPCLDSHINCIVCQRNSSLPCITISIHFHCLHMSFLPCLTHYTSVLLCSIVLHLCYDRGKEYTVYFIFPFHSCHSLHHCSLAVDDHPSGCI